MPYQVVAAIKTKKLVAVATKKQRSTISIGQSLNADRSVRINPAVVCIK